MFGEKVVSKVSLSPLAIWGGKKNRPNPDASLKNEQLVSRTTGCFAHLIFNSDLSSQGVVSVPLLSEGQPILWSFVFGFQAACNFAGISVGGP